VEVIELFRKQLAKVAADRDQGYVVDRREMFMLVFMDF
jgi:hypothetical protein